MYAPVAAVGNIQAGWTRPPGWKYKKVLLILETIQQNILSIDSYPGSGGSALCLSDSVFAASSIQPKPESWMWQFNQVTAVQLKPVQWMEGKTVGAASSSLSQLPQPEMRPELNVSPVYSFRVNSTTNIKKRAAQTWNTELETSKSKVLSLRSTWAHNDDTFLTSSFTSG